MEALPSPWPLLWLLAKKESHYLYKFTRGGRDKELACRDLVWRAGRGLLKEKAYCTSACSSQAQRTGSDAYIRAAHKTTAILKYILFPLPMSRQLLGDLYASRAW